MFAGFRDVKQNFGFSKYQVKSRKSINRFVQLSFVAASLTKLIFTTQSVAKTMSVESVCQQLGIHWYRPAKLTLGLRTAFLRLRIAETLFSASSKQKSYSQNIRNAFQQEEDTPCDKAT